MAFDAADPVHGRAHAILEIGSLLVPVAAALVLALPPRRRCWEARWRWRLRRGRDVPPLPVVRLIRRCVCKYWARIRRVVVLLIQRSGRRCDAQEVLECSAGRLEAQR